MIAAAVLALAVTPPVTGAPSASASACVTCHAQLEGDAKKSAEAWPGDVHAAAGLGCESCHGGDPSSAHADDGDAAMDPKKGFKPAPDRLHVPEFCARCHSDAAYMKRFDPKMRVDQLVEYRTSTHGRLNAAGDPVPATCTDCHGAHGVRAVSSPESPAYATNVPQTCARCHADEERMARYGIPTDQYARYRGSVHATALLDRRDTSAPACNDCHGNHGAAPPGIQSVANVCGQCHGREAALFRASRKKAIFDDMSVPECTACHENHGIRHPTPELFHSGSAPQVSAGRVTSLDPFEADLGDLAAGEARSASWRVALDPHVASDASSLAHRVEVSADGMAPIVVDATIRPGATVAAPPRTASAGGLAATLAIVPLSGDPVGLGDALLLRLEVRAGGAVRDVTVKDRPGSAVSPVVGSACRSCHEEGDACDKATETMYAALSTLDTELRRSAGILHQAEIAGMEVRNAQFELKSKGATAAIEARALVHTFDPERLLARVEEGRKTAADADRAGHAALDELQFRRKGLAASLILVGLVLVGLFLQIRQIDRLRAESRLRESP